LLGKGIQYLSAVLVKYPVPTYPWSNRRQYETDTIWNPQNHQKAHAACHASEDSNASWRRFDRRVLLQQLHQHRIDLFVGVIGYHKVDVVVAGLVVLEYHGPVRKLSQKAGNILRVSNSICPTCTSGYHKLKCERLIFWKGSQYSSAIPGNISPSSKRFPQYLWSTMLRKYITFQAKDSLNTCEVQCWGNISPSSKRFPQYLWSTMLRKYITYKQKIPSIPVKYNAEEIYHLQAKDSLFWLPNTSAR
jgi:hypothetical protein